MSLLIFSLRRQQIIARKAELNYALLQLSQKTQELNQYASSIANGSPSLSDMLKAPSSMTDRMMAFNQNANAYAMQNYNQKGQFMENIYKQNAQRAGQQVTPQDITMLRQSMFEQAKGEVAKREQALLSMQDKEIESKRARMETELKSLEAEEETVKKGEEQGAKNSAPQYVA